MRRDPSSKRLPAWWWWGLGAALVALAVLLALQYRWLRQLEQTSTAAAQAALERYLDTVVEEVQMRYLEIGDEILRVEPAELVADPVDVAARLATREPEAAHALFVTSFVSSDSRLYLVDQGATPANPDRRKTIRAVEILIAPWRVRAQNGVAWRERRVLVDESDPDHRLVVRPIAEPSGQLVGVVGMVLDPDYFRHQVLPAAIRIERPPYCPDGWAAVAVRDGRGVPVLPANDDRDWDGKVSRSFEGVFEDWQIGLLGAYASPDVWARGSFLINVSLSVALVALLLGATGLVLRSVAREVHLSQLESEFVSSVSHQLRTPLTAIRAFGELLARGRIDDASRVRAYGDRIERESRVLTRLIDEVLDFSRLDAGFGSDRTEEPVSIEEVVAEACRQFEHGPDQRIEVSAPDSPLPPVVADRQALCQALANMIDNGLKYSPPDTPVEIRFASHRGSVVVAIIDHGPGIPEADRERVFDRFCRLPSAAGESVPKGAGLGLAIVRLAVEACAGEVRIDDTAGGGCTFTLHLRTTDDHENPDETAAPGHVPGEVQARAIRPTRNPLEPGEAVIR